MKKNVLKITQTQIAKKVGISQPRVNAILNGKGRPSWPTAKRLVKAIPGTTTELWLDGTPEEIRAAIDASCRNVVALEKHNQCVGCEKHA